MKAQFIQYYEVNKISLRILNFLSGIEPYYNMVKIYHQLYKAIIILIISIQFVLKANYLICVIENICSHCFTGGDKSAPFNA